MTRPFARFATCCLIAFTTTVANPVNGPLAPASATAQEFPETPDGTNVVRAFVRAHEFDKAIEVATTLILNGTADADQLTYLKALAHHELNQHDAAVALLEKFSTTYPDSRWRRKAAFLNASALIELRRFEQAQVVYETEAHRLLSDDRRERLAQILVTFADELSKTPDPLDLGAPPPDHNRAYSFYQRAIDMQIGTDMRDEVLYKLANAAMNARQLPAAINHFRAYLDEFDPTWRGPVGSLERMRQDLEPSDAAPGAHRWNARLRLAQIQIQMNQFEAARLNFEDLEALLTDDSIPDADTELLDDTRWGIALSWSPPLAPNASHASKSIKALERFNELHPNHPNGTLASWHIAAIREGQGYYDDAAAAFRAFFDKTNFELPTGEDVFVNIDGTSTTAPEFYATYKPLALYKIASIRFGQQKFTDAIALWNQYINTFPNGSQWADSQRLIRDAQIAIAEQALADEEYDKAEQLYAEFLAANPLDQRAPQILFTLGQIPYGQAEELREDTGLTMIGVNPEDGEPESITNARRLYQTALGKWANLASKYPSSYEAALGLMRSAMMWEFTLGDLERALAQYRRVTGPLQPEAQKRIAAMTAKTLAVQSERTFRSSETPLINVTGRNLKKLTIRKYAFDPEAYFRKTHQISGVEDLDIALIAPDSEWTIDLDDTRPYMPFERDIPIPVDGSEAGVWIINVSTDTLETTTLVVRSDLEVIVSASRTEALVYAQNMARNTPAANVPILLSDGTNIIASDSTGDDGVLRMRLDALAKTGTLQAFALDNGHIASAATELRGDLPTPMRGRGYVYTDRSTYQPGQVAHVRGIIRAARNNDFYAPANQSYNVIVNDASGRTIASETAILNRFGAFDIDVVLPEHAPLGNYAVVVSHEQPELNVPCAATFSVQQFVLPNVEVDIEFDQQWYKRGDVITATATASYYWGEPLRNEAVTAALADGSVLTGMTDDEGQFEIEFDTSGVAQARTLAFHVRIDRLALSTTSATWVALPGFKIDASTVRDIALAGEPFDLNITTTAIDNTPTGRDLKVDVLQFVTEELSPVLRGLPWINRRPAAQSTITVQTHNISTDDNSGKATLALTLDEGGSYIFRVQGDDDGETMFGSHSIMVSDDTDDTRLRVFSDSDTFNLGESITLDVHSRSDKALALVTCATDTIIEHRIVEVNNGHNDINIELMHDHYPWFNFSVAIMDGRDVHSVTRAYVVQRRLDVEIKPQSDSVLPGEVATVEITAHDQLGQPVEAEFSLAMIDQALFAAFPDNARPIQDVFEADHRNQSRAASVFALGWSNSFHYAPITTAIDQALLDEDARLALQSQEELLRDAVRSQLGQTDFGLEADRSLEAYALQYLGGQQADNERAGEAMYFAHKSVRGAASGGGVGGGGGGGSIFDDPDDAVAGGRMILESAVAPAVAAAPRTRSADVGRGRESQNQQRQNLDHDGFWMSNIVTNAQGKAIVEVPCPTKTSRWRLHTKGASVDSLVGEATTFITTRKDFFVNYSTPRHLVEGDQIQLAAKIHNLTDFHGPVTATLTVDHDGNTVATSQRTVSVEAEQGADLLFDAFTVPDTKALTFNVTVDNGTHRDALRRNVQVQPWGLMYADHAGGIASDNQVITLSLPDSRNYRSRDLTLTIGPDANIALLNMLRGDNSWIPAHRIPNAGPDGIAASLLAAVAGARYSTETRQPTQERTEFLRNARAHVASLVVMQSNDGGWGWMHNSGSEWSTSAHAVQALAAAQSVGIEVNPSTMDRAEKYLRNAFARAESNEHTARAVILAALATIDAADFELANALYRERNQLSPIALAYGALVLTSLDRNEIANELLNILTKQAIAESNRSRIHWNSNPKDGSWWTNDAETTAIAVRALIAARPTDPNIEPAVQYLLHQDGMRCGSSSTARGHVATALTDWFARGQFNNTEFALDVSLNNKSIATVRRAENVKPVTITIPAGAINDGQNIIRIKMNGRGQYAFGASLLGFSDTFDDPKSWNYPYLNRRSYMHDTLMYKQRPLNARSSSPVQNLEVGQRTRVEVSVRSGSTNEHLVVEEALPSGTTLVSGSLSGNFINHEIRDGKIIMYHQRGRSVTSFQYELIGTTTGAYRALPTVIRDAVNPGRMRVGQVSNLNVLAPDESSDDPYKMNDGERMELGTHAFNDGDYEVALEYLWPLFDRQRKYSEREVARMLLWIHTRPEFYNASRIVSAFEILSIRHPDLTIPFDRILVVGKAYRDLGEFERSYLVYRATINSSFVIDSNLSAILEDEGQLLGSTEYQQALWWEYPDTPDVAASYFAISQRLFQQADNARNIATTFRPFAADLLAQTPDDDDDDRRFQSAADISSAAMIAETIDLITDFMTYYPNSPLCDDAAFSLANAVLKLEDFDRVIQLSETYRNRFDESEFATSFQYMQALGHFWNREYDDAVAAADPVANGDSKDRDFARYILGQVHHAENNPAEAVRWYEKVKTLYPDAAEAIDYFNRKIIEIDEVSVVRPGEPVELDLRYRNMEAANLQVYRVDLMKLYLREKNLSKITNINLAGIEPLLVEDITLGGSLDFVDQTYTSTLPIEDVGAYLVICRGDNLFTSGLVLVTPLRLDVQEDPRSGRVRVNVTDESTGDRPVNVHVKAIGTNDTNFASGDTDLRGIFVADNINGTVTVIARDDQSRYAFHRGTTHVGAGPDQQNFNRGQYQEQFKNADVNYLDNIMQQNDVIQEGNYRQWDKSRRNLRDGVQIKDAK